MRAARVEFPLFARFARVSAWVTAAYTPLGRLLGALLVASAIFATDPGRTQSAALLAMLAAVFGVARVANLGWHPALRVARSLPAMATAGIPVSYTLRLTNIGTQPEPALEVRDALEQPEPTRALCALRTGARDDADNWFDRRVGYRRWQRLRGGRIAPRSVHDLGPGSTREVEIVFTPLRRGRLRFSHVEFARRDPLGVSFRRIRLSRADGLLVLPRHYPLPAFARWLAGGGHRTGGAAGDGQRAGSEEFHSLREYRRGDAWRHVHWRASARRGDIVVRQFVTQGRPPVSILFDADGDATLFEAALEVVTSLVVAAVLHARQVPEVLFAAPGGHVARLPGSTTQRSVGSALLHVLADLQFVPGRTTAATPPWPIPVGHHVLLVTTCSPTLPGVAPARPRRAGVGVWQILQLVADSAALPPPSTGVRLLRASQLDEDLRRLDAELRLGPSR